VSECVLLCRRENVGRTTLNLLLNLARLEEKSERLLQVYGDNVIKKTSVYKWVTRFSEGRECVTDEERSGRPATNGTEENIETFVELCEKIVA
jgi:hypothetical protein